MAIYFCQLYAILFAPFPFLCIYLWSDVNELNNNVDGCKTPLVVVCNTGMEILERLRFGDNGNERCTITMIWRHCFPAAVAFLSSHRNVPRTLSHSYLFLPYQCSSKKMFTLPRSLQKQVLVSPTVQVGSSKAEWSEGNRVLLNHSQWITQFRSHGHFVGKSGLSNKPVFPTCVKR